jgi:hypothetical protein
MDGQTNSKGEAREKIRALLTHGRRLVARACSFAQPRRGRRSPPETHVWAGRLEEEKNRLLSLVGTMELEFLDTGEGLSRLAAQLGDIRQKCRTLSDLTLGHSEDAAVQFAFHLLKKSEDLVLASYEQYDHVFATFSELQQQLVRLSRQHDALMRVLLPLNFITLSFRIEASRHPVEVQQAFFTLAASVNKTVDEVRRTMERQFEEIAASEQIARNLIGQIFNSIQLHREQISTTLKASREQLHALSESLDRCQAGTSDLARLNETVNRHIGTIVMAQQCHDITRQKIEHVGEAMAEMSGHLHALRPEDVTAAAEERHFIWQAGQIQLQQVQSVFNELNDAAASIKTGIHGLRTEADAAAGAVVRVGATALDARISNQCQSGTTGILDVVHQAVEKIGVILAAFKPLQASFVDCTGKATTLAGDVRHAGLNAQVFAIHAPDGSTLEVLAGRVRLISEDVIQHVEQMRNDLHHTAAMIDNLHQRLEDFQLMARAEEKVLADESARSREKLSDLETAIPILIQDVSRQQEKFAHAVGDVLDHVRFPETVAATSACSLGFFHELVAWGAAGSTDPAHHSAAARKLDRLKANYTMASEQNAHVAALQTPGEPVSAAVTAVEMFDEPPAAPPSAAVPVALPVSEATLPAAPLTAAAAEPPAPDSGLGDNVDLF